MKTSNYVFRSAVSLASLILLAFFISACGTGPDSTANKLLNSGNIAPDETFGFTFEEEGTVDYFCSIHAPTCKGL